MVTTYIVSYIALSVSSRIFVVILLFYYNNLFVEHYLV